MKRKKICLDYGHGGKDSGAVYQNRREADDNLRIGKMIRAELLAYGMEVIETRREDIWVSLNERVYIGNTKNVDYFISIHRNAFRPEKAKGVESYIYIYSNDTTKALALNIQKSLVEIGFKDRGVKYADFYVIRKTIAPVILIEIGFIDNSLDNFLFDKRLKKISNSIAQEIIKI